METLPALDNRLALLASLVRAGCTCADIGTDHGYLITSLVKSGVCPRGFACDINEMPLEQSRATARRCGVEDRISFVLSDGLARLDENEIDDVIIAGMGGNLIADILESAAWHSGKQRFLLQPMTRADELRRRLCAGGYELCAEDAARENGFCYTVITVRYSGVRRECTPLFAAVGLLASAKTPQARAYIKKQAELLEKRIRGLEGSETRTAEAIPLRPLYNDILKLIEEDNDDKD